jgi:SAM-dependent methyltransferase
MTVAALKKKFRFLEKTPFHPQWLVSGKAKMIFSLLQNVDEQKLVLDIGCANKWPKGYLPGSCKYVGLDYFETARDWYGTTPDVYGDALNIPLKPESFDVVLLLDVMEHIGDAERLFDQVHDVLKPGGMVIVSVPFLYPLHDEPRDFARYSSYGLHQLTSRHNFTIEICEAIGSPLVTSTVLLNISLAKTVINWMAARKLVSVLGVIVPFLILATNLLAKCASLIEKPDNFMPLAYAFTARKLDRCPARQG